ncbi:hypothetical protein, partial [Citrobacter braakii]|uniref:hypothetical protein n=1 Tax=Citrobacter braakii TaxID=57706 RepID=UPI001C6FCC71
MLWFKQINHTSEAENFTRHFKVIGVNMRDLNPRFRKQKPLAPPFGSQPEAFWLKSSLSVVYLMRWS